MNCLRRFVYQKQSRLRGYNKWLVRTLAVASETSLMICSNRAVSSACRWVWRAIFSLNFLGFAMIAKHLLTALRDTVGDKTQQRSGSHRTSSLADAFPSIFSSLLRIIINTFFFHFSYNLFIILEQSAFSNTIAFCYFTILHFCTA